MGGNTGGEYLSINTSITPHIITKKQQEILHLVYRFRFINRIQIQSILNHKDHKTINTWLKNLTQKNYITRTYNNTFQYHNKPAQYNIAKNGITFLKSTSKYKPKQLQKFYRESERSEKFRNKCMFIADVYTSLRINNMQSLRFYTQMDYPANGVIREIMPTFGYIIAEHEKQSTFIAEIFTEEQPRFYIRSKIRKYAEYLVDEPDTKVMFICPNEKSQKYILRFTRNLLLEDENSSLFVMLTTVEKIQQYGWIDDIWEIVLVDD